jgi:hypothetical protein
MSIWIILLSFGYSEGSMRMVTPKLDTIGWFIATTHQLLGHDKAASVIGVPPGNSTECAICRYEKTHSEEDRIAVLVALSPK